MGKIFIILNNTLNGFIHPCLAQLVMGYAKDDFPSGNEPLFTSKDPFQFAELTQEVKQETVLW